MNVNSSFLGVGLLLLAALIPGSPNAELAVRFLAVGDLPYSESEQVLLGSLLEQELAGHPPFVVHVGDIKGGSSPCTRAALARIADLFRALPVPVVYTPGDNEWTDCRRPAAGGYDPGERLSLLRQLFYSDPSVLKLSELGAEADEKGFPEDYRFLHRGVLFAAVHVVGSHNNLNPDDAEALAEHQARSSANRRHLELVAAAANEAGASAIVLLFHANPGFESASPPRGYGAFFEDLRRLLGGFPGPVLAIHGDTHRYEFDHPLRDSETGTPVPRFTRLEVPGSPTVAGVWVTVDPGATEPFAVELAYPDARRVLMKE